MKRVTALGSALILMSLVPGMPCQAYDESDIANDSKFFVGLGLGGASLTEDSVFIDESGAMYKVFAGYRATDLVAFEAALLQFDGVDVFNALEVPSRRSLSNTHGINASAVLSIPISERFWLNGKAGLLYWSTDRAADGSDDSGTDVTAGFGLNFRIMDALTLSIDYERLQFGELDGYAGMLSLSYQF